MPDFNVRSDSVNVEQIMEQIRSRIREKRGVDYTEEQIRELAAVKLEKFLDPRAIRSDLLDQFNRSPDRPARPTYVFEDSTIFETHRGLLRFVRRLLHPILKLFFNPNPIIQALHIQSQLNALSVEREKALDSLHTLHFELLHNIVLETTRLGVEVKNLKMHVESLGSRVEFNERRARALESVVVYKPGPESADSAPRDRVSQPPTLSTSSPMRNASSSWQSRSGQQRQRYQSGAQASPAGDQREEQRKPPSSSAAYSADPGQTTEQAPTQGAEQSPSTVPGQASAAAPGQGGEGPGQRSRRRRRRRGRRGGAPATAIMGPSANQLPDGQSGAGSQHDEIDAHESPAEEPEPGAHEPDGQ